MTTYTTEDLIEALRAGQLARARQINHAIEHNSLEVYIAARKVLKTSRGSASICARTFTAIMSNPGISLATNYRLLIALHMDACSLRVNTEIASQLVNAYKLLRNRHAGRHITADTALKDSLLTNVSSVYDPRAMIELGYFPVFKGELREACQYALSCWLEGYSYEELLDRKSVV